MAEFNPELDFEEFNADADFTPAGNKKTFGDTIMGTDPNTGERDRSAGNAFGLGGDIVDAGIGFAKGAMNTATMVPRKVSQIVETVGKRAVAKGGAENIKQIADLSSRMNQALMAMAPGDPKRAQLQQAIKDNEALIARLSGNTQATENVQITEDPNNILNKVTKPTNTAQKIGFGAENIAEYIFSGGAKPTGSMLSRMFKSAGEFGTITGAQTGDLEDVATSAATGFLMPPVQAGAKWLWQKVAPKVGDAAANIIAMMTGKEPEHIKMAFKNPVEIANRIKSKVTTGDVREKSVAALDSYRAKVSKQFTSSLDDAVEAYGQRSASGAGVRDSGGKFTQTFKNSLSDLKEGLPGQLRELRIAVENNGRTLNFDKLNSKIVSAGERRNLQMLWDTLQNQKNFSVQTVQDVSARLYALKTFTEGERTVASVAAGKMYDVYSKAIAKTYPKLGAARQEYAIAEKGIDYIDDLIRSGKDSPTATTGVVKKLTNLFAEDNDAYVKAITMLEKLSGQDLLKDLVATEFQRTFPGKIGSTLTMAGFGAAGAATNPLTLMLLPLFSPKVEGKIITGLGKASQKAIPETLKAGYRAVPFITR